MLAGMRAGQMVNSLFLRALNPSILTPKKYRLDLPSTPGFQSPTGWHYISRLGDPNFKPSSKPQASILGKGPDPTFSATLETPKVVNNSCGFGAKS